MSGSAHTRSMRESDLDRVAEIHVAAWRMAYAGIVRSERMDSLSVAKARGAWRRRFGAAHMNHMVCEWDGELVGFASYGSSRKVRGRPVEPGVAEIYALYVHPERWRLGCGRALLDAVVARLHGEWEALALWTLKENGGARAFYVGAGFQEVRNSSRPRADLGADVLLLTLPLL